MDNLNRHRGSADDVAQETVCVDFDGVLNQYEGWAGVNELYEPREHAAEFLEELNDLGYRVAVYTTRAEISVIRWLEKHDLKQYVAEVTVKKPPAVAYIDDRAIRFEGDFEEVVELLDDFAPFWAPEEEDGEAAD